MVKELARPTTPLRRGAAPDTAWAFFNGEFVPLRDAKVSVLTHAFNYGTGVFEGIRAYWNPEHGQLYGLHLLEHYRRLHKSCRVMRLDLPYPAERLVEITVELLARSGYREDCYVRPLVYKSSELIGVRRDRRRGDTGPVHGRVGRLGGRAHRADEAGRVRHQHRARRRLGHLRAEDAVDHRHPEALAATGHAGEQGRRLRRGRLPVRLRPQG